MKFKNVYPIFFFFLLIFSSVSVLGVQEVGELTILYPKQTVYSLDYDSELSFQAFNSTGSILINSDYDCIIKVYDVNGVEEYSGALTNNIDTYTKTYTVNSSAHIDLGVHSYNLWCNNSVITGAVSNSYTVSTGGADTNILNNSLTGIFLLLGLGLIAFISLSSSSYISDKKLEGIKLFLWGFGLLHIMIISGILMLQSLSETDIGNILRYNDVLIGYFIIITLAILYIIYYYIGYYFIDNVTDDNYGGRK